MERLSSNGAGTMKVLGEANMNFSPENAPGMMTMKRKLISKNRSQMPEGEMVDGAFVIKAIYEDDEPLISQRIGQPAMQYDYRTGVEFSVRSYGNIEYSASGKEVPVLVSLKTQEYDFEKCTLGKDVVCVIDNSGSMKGEKIQLVKDAFAILLEYLKPNDRVSLISFESSAERLCPLTKCTPEGKVKLVQYIERLRGAGGTDISSGMRLAAQVLKDRRQANDITGVFLLSDGEDSGADEKVRSMFDKYDLGNKVESAPAFAIYSFGFGSDHDAKLMRGIANLKDGSFYFINSLGSIRECFLDALGGLLSVVCSKVSIKVSVNQTARPENPKVKIVKTFGNQWTVVRETQATIQFNHLRSGARRDFIFLLEIPKDRTPHDFQIQVTAEARAKSLLDHVNPNYISQSGIIIPVQSLYGISPEALDPEVNEQVTRVQGAEALELAAAAAESGNSAHGEQIIERAIEAISNRPELPGEGETRKKILKGLDQTRDTLKQKGKDQAVLGLIRELGGVHMDQNSSVKEAMYSNGTQKRILKKK